MSRIALQQGCHLSFISRCCRIPNVSEFKDQDKGVGVTRMLPQYVDIRKEEGRNEERRRRKRRRGGGRGEEGTIMNEYRQREGSRWFLTKGRWVVGLRERRKQ